MKTTQLPDYNKKDLNVLFQISYHFESESIRNQRSLDLWKVSWYHLNLSFDYHLNLKSLIPSNVMHFLLSKKYFPISAEDCYSKCSNNLLNGSKPMLLLMISSLNYLVYNPLSLITLLIYWTWIPHKDNQTIPNWNRNCSNSNKES